ncbi:MAG: hypothetical protein AAF466_01215 [Bacteroidota bacterium]
MKLLLTTCLLFLTIAAFSQEVERTTAKGMVKVPASTEKEGISIYNISSQRGTITNENGEFELAIAANDRLLVTALQFESRELAITEEDVLNKSLLIYLNPNVYKLGAAIVRSTDLMGYAQLDAKQIETSVYAPGWDLSYAALEFGYNFENDGQVGVTGNAAEEALNVNAVPQASVDMGILFRTLFPKKNKSDKEVIEDQRVATNALLDRYPQYYIANTFKIPEDRVNDFVFYTEENGLTPYLMRTENEIELLEFLLQRSLEYKKRLSNGG